MASLTPAEIRALLEELAALREEVRELREENGQLRAENARLREQLGRTPRNSSRPPSSEHPHAKPTPARRRKSSRKRGGQSGHERHQRDLIPVEQCHAVHDLKPQHCTRCGEALDGEDGSPRRQQVTDLPPVVPTVTEYRRHTLTCDCCGTPSTAPDRAACRGACSGRGSPRWSPCSGRSSA